MKAGLQNSQGQAALRCNRDRYRRGEPWPWKRHPTTIQCTSSLVCSCHHSTLVFSGQPSSYLSLALDFSKSMFWMILAPQFMAAGCRRCADFWMCVLPIYAQLVRDGASIFASTAEQLGRRAFELRHYKFVDKISHPTASPERSAEFVAWAVAMLLAAGKKGPWRHGGEANCSRFECAFYILVLILSMFSVAFPYPACDAFLGQLRTTNAGNAPNAQPRRGYMTSIPRSWGMLLWDCAATTWKSLNSFPCPSTAGPRQSISTIYSSTRLYLYL